MVCAAVSVNQNLQCERAMKFSVFILLFWIPSIVFCAERVDSVLVVKSKSALYLIKDGKTLSSFHIVFGANPKGHKIKEGDERTPEGHYILDYKKSDSAFYKAIHISYPNDHDRKRAKEAGVNPGGSIMIHGQKNGFGWLSWLSQKFNWTNGCIALTNAEMDQVWERVEVGTPIEIRP